MRELDEVFPKVKLENFKNLPIKILNEIEQVPVIKMVDQILELNQKLLKIGDKHTDETVRIEREIAKIDAKIDQLVYNIYFLTEDAKVIIEDALKK